MGSWSGSCDKVCRVHVPWLASPVPFCFWRLCLWRISFSLLCFCSFVCLIPSLVTMGIFTAKGRGWFCKDCAALLLLNLFKKTLRASTVQSILSGVFLSYTASALTLLCGKVKPGECLKVFPNFHWIHPKQSSSVWFHGKAVKTQTGCFNPCVVCMWTLTAVSFLLHEVYIIHVHNWQRILVPVVD